MHLIGARALHMRRAAGSRVGIRAVERARRVRGGCIHLERRDGRANTAQRLPHTRAPAPSPPAPIAASAHASAAEKGSHPESSRIKVEQYFGGRFCGTTGRRRNAPSDSLERDAADLGGARRA